MPHQIIEHFIYKYDIINSKFALLITKITVSNDNL
jgi:hypothetical protein